MMIMILMMTLRVMTLTMMTSSCERLGSGLPLRLSSELLTQPKVVQLHDKYIYEGLSKAQNVLIASNALKAYPAPTASAPSPLIYEPLKAVPSPGDEFTPADLPLGMKTEWTFPIIQAYLLKKQN